MQKQQRTLVNCDLCGRDTRNKSRVCVHCTGGRLEAAETDEDRELAEVRRKLHGDHGYTRDADVAEDVARKLDDMTSN